MGSPGGLNRSVIWSLRPRTPGTRITFGQSGHHRCPACPQCGGVMQVPAHFEYEKATSVDHALDLLSRWGAGARVVAGGHSLLPMMKLRLARPEALIDINDLSELDYIRMDGDELGIGAMTRHRDLLNSSIVAAQYPIFRDAERVIADPIVRNRGTVGGSLCQADPSEDLS